jgi:hypothetical protein
MCGRFGVGRMGRTGRGVARLNEMRLGFPGVVRGVGHGQSVGAWDGGNQGQNSAACKKQSHRESVLKYGDSVEAEGTLGLVFGELSDVPEDGLPVWCVLHSPRYRRARVPEVLFQSISHCILLRRAHLTSAPRECTADAALGIVHLAMVHKRTVTRDRCHDNSCFGVALGRFWFRTGRAGGRPGCRGRCARHRGFD